ncbi:MAG TPA: Yip1 family protein [Thermoanaerobaculia bacterium]|nr:Yip1 family protein [Thermoanaerobaculia bacterium]
MTAVDASSQPVPPNAEPKPNPWQRIVGVFFSPTETMQSIARRPDIVVPLVILLVCSALMGVVIGMRVDFAAAAMENMPPNAPAAQAESAMKMAAMIGKISSFVAPLFTLIGLAIIAGVLLIAFRIMGGEGDYKQAFSVLTYASFPTVLKSLITAIVLLARSGVGAQELETLVRSNAAFLVEQKTNPILFSLLTSFDVFTIWFVILLIIGFAAISRFSKAKSAAIIISLWMVAIVVKLGFVALGAAMRNKAAAA